MKYFLSEDKIIGLIRAHSFDELKNKLHNVYAAGIHTIEISLTCECAFQAIKWTKENFEDVSLGAASIINIEQLKQAIDCGIDFATTPMIDPEIMSYCIESKIDLIPGAATPTEIVQIIKNYYFPYIKLFPAHSAAFYQSIKKVFPKQEFILSSFPIEEIEDLQKIGGCKYAIGSYFTDTLDANETIARVSQLRQILKNSK